MSGLLEPEVLQESFEEAEEVELLKELLLQQTLRSEQLGQQAADRDWERWELLQLLRQKDEQLEYEETAASRQRAVLASARNSTKHYRAICALRAWRDHVQTLCAERALLRAKNKLQSGRVRHACSLFRVVLKHSLERKLGWGMQALWLHAASEDLPTERRVLKEPGNATGGSSSRPGTALNTACHVAGFTGVAEDIQDSVLFTTPRKQRSSSKLQPPFAWPRCAKGRGIC